jgi:hypothetical protein
MASSDRLNDDSQEPIEVAFRNLRKRCLFFKLKKFSPDTDFNDQKSENIFLHGNPVMSLTDRKAAIGDTRTSLKRWLSSSPPTQKEVRHADPSSFFHRLLRWCFDWIAGLKTKATHGSYQSAR